MHNCRRKRYTLLNFGFDLFMLFITAGIWILWIIIREWRMR